MCFFCSVLSGEVLLAYHFKKGFWIMQTFEFVIKEELGIHARPAGLLVKLASNYQSSIEMKMPDGRAANLKKLFAVMGLGVKCGNRIRMNIDGADEITAARDLKKFFEKNL
jgi:phosphocarrier protein HPr